jgi:thiol-disulfide isomerase/thioredoxin
MVFNLRPSGLSMSLTMAVLACPEITLQNLDALLAAKKDPVAVKFFASWCGSCKDDLESMRGKSSDPHVILLSAFDDETAAVATLNHFGVDQACFNGDAIARKLGVRHLPRSFVSKDGHLVSGDLK